MTIPIRLFIIPCLIFSTAHADLKIIANPSIKNALIVEDIRNAYLGKGSQKVSDLHVLDYSRNSTLRQVFLEQVISITPTAFRAHWSRMIFTGNSVPPANVSSEDEMIHKVQQESGAVGYVSSEFKIPEGVKVQLVVPASHSPGPAN